MPASSSSEPPSDPRQPDPRQPDPLQPDPNPRRRRSLFFRFLRAIGLLAVRLYVGDFGYSLFAKWKHDAWEATVQRDENGIMEGC